MKNVRTVIGLVAVVVSTVAAGQEVRVHQFRSMDDARVVADPSVCAAAPFAVNLRLAASLWSTQTRSRDGRVVNDDARRIGTATACGQITNFAFPPGLQQNFHVRFDLPDGSYTASGTCTLVSNNVPQGGVVLAGCSLKVISAPHRVVGGMATSASVLNPFGLAGFNTGSYWTLMVYEEPRTRGHHASEPSRMEWVEEQRSAAEIQAAGETK